MTSDPAGMDLSLWLPHTGNAYIDSCFHLSYRQQTETRDWRMIPELADIPALVDRGERGLAMKKIQSALSQYPDFDFPYVWLGQLHLKALKPDAARKSYLDGMEHARSKIALTDQLGQLAWNTGSLAEAVQWWIGSCTCQVIGQMENAHPFLMLATIASNAKHKKEAELLFQQCDTIQNIRLNERGQQECKTLWKTQGSPTIARAILIFCDVYLRRKKTSVKQWWQFWKT
ncbi:MAG: hypothetical protein HPY85_16600 [Anaerolineae bacterium]|nr:hypothetical protein [Anaerolineae bacterium]